MVPIHYSVEVLWKIRSDYSACDAEMIKLFKAIVIEDFIGVYLSPSIRNRRGYEMLGIIVTLFAVLAVICCAFYYSEHPSARGSKNDALFYMAPKYLKHQANKANRKNQ